MCVTLEAARKHLLELWASSSRTFKFLATPVKEPKAPPPPKAKPAPVPRLTDSESFDVTLIGMAPPAQDEAKGKGKADAESDGDASGTGGASSSSSSSSGSGSDVRSQLRAGWIPFGARPSPKPKEAPARKVPKKTMHRPEASMLDLLSPAVELPQQLGRGDVHQKRKHKVERTTVPIVAGEDGVSEELAPKMRRSQDYAIPNKRSDILVECVKAYRAAAR
jgi:hypothetical protein